jgi:hypothetical protein
MSVAKKNEDLPLIPESYFDAPTQRLYALSLGLLCQVSLNLFKETKRVLTFELGSQSF